MSAKDGITQIVVDSARGGKATPYIVAGSIVVGGILVTYIVIKVLEGLQLKDTRQEKKESRKTLKLTSEQAFDPTHAYNKPSKVTITQLKAEGLAQTIYNASGYVKAKSPSEDTFGVGQWLGWAYDDDEEAVRGAIRQAGTSYNLSKVAQIFYNKYKVGLLDHIEGFSNHEEMSKIYDIVDNFKS